MMIKNNMINFADGVLQFAFVLLLIGVLFAIIIPDISKSDNCININIGSNFAEQVPKIIILAVINIAFAIARAKNVDAPFMRTILFLWGSPFSWLTYFAIREGSNNAFGYNLAYLD